jgi:VIT1/CCC1 family predicted Fe2+/Mn2+ transporter
LTTEATSELTLVATQACRDELTDYEVYRRLSEETREKSPKLSEILSKLSDTEFKHYQFWKKYVAEKKTSIEVNNLIVRFVLLLRIFFGPTFAVKYLERHENKVIRRYKSVAHLIPSEDRATFQQIISDEEEHEDSFTNQMQKGRISYLQFVVLGLADALVEIGGIHAGSLGIYNSTELTGLAGIIAGASASIAMASAAYAQAKSGFQGSPVLSAFYTGISYFINAVLLATPYFLTKTMSLAISSSLTVAVAIIAFISYYNSVIANERFLRYFGELTGIMLGASAALYVIGEIIRLLLHITV